jgi:5-bromo-4-chloroindolyl phosphate hydrolysis protein
MLHRNNPQFNILLFQQDFLEMTKQMEGDGPKLSMVIYEYVRLLDNLKIKETLAAATPLYPMFDPMIQLTNKYLELALKCDTVITATFFHLA